MTEILVDDTHTKKVRVAATPSKPEPMSAAEASSRRTALEARHVAARPRRSPLVAVVIVLGSYGVFITGFSVWLMV